MGPLKGSDLLEYGRANGSCGIGTICKPQTCCAFLPQPDNFNKQLVSY